MVGVSIVPGLLLCLFAAMLQDAWGHFSPDPENLVVNETESGSVVCGHTDPNATLSWQRQNITIDAGTPGYGVSDGQSGESILTILNASPDQHTGNYTCIASFPGEVFETASFTVTVQFVGPVSVQMLTEGCTESEERVFWGSDLTLTCILPSSSVPSIIPEDTLWFRDTIQMEITPAPNRHPNGTRLVLQGVSSMDSANYFCQVSNGPLSRNSGVINIAVITKLPPRTVQVEYQGSGERGDDDGEIFVREDEPSIIHCFISPLLPSFTSDIVTWTRDRNIITSGQNGLVVLVNPNQPCNYTVIITSTNENNIGTFQCRLQESNEVKIASLSLKLARIPQRYSLTITPPNSILGEGRDITFLCMASTDPAANVMESIRWEFVSAETGVPLPVEGDGSRVVVGERQLEIRGLRVSDSGEYVCVAFHELVSPVRTRVSLAVEASLPVLVTPNSPVVRLGTPLTLTCTIQSPRPATFSWAIGTVSVTESDRLKISNSSTQTTLNITSLMPSDLGNITCLANDPLHQQLSNSAIVRETTQLYFFGDEIEKTAFVPAGSPLTLECPIRPRSVPKVVQWFAGSMELYNGSDGVQIITAQNGSSLVTLQGMVTVEMDNQDRYLCIVNDNWKYSIQLYVTIPGNITKFPPPMVNGTLGRPFRLDCEASGRPTPQIFWFQGSTNLSERVNSSIRDAGNGTLLFQSVSMDDAAIYFCVITTPPVQRNTFLHVQPAREARSSGVLGLNQYETILVFMMVGIVGFFLLLMLGLLLVLCCCCYLDRVSRGRYLISKASAYEGGSLKNNSLKKMRQGDNSGILMGNATPITETLQQAQFVDPVERHVRLDDETRLHTFHMGSESLLSESQVSSPVYHGTMVTTPSHNSMSSPNHGTMATTSMYRSEDHPISLENGLPNFPRMNVRLEELMGQGEFGPVMKAVARGLVPGEHETEVAVKLLVTETVEDTGFRADLAMVDYANHMKLRHRNIAAILGICSDEEPYHVMYEYLDRGDLKNFLLSSRPEEGLPPKLMHPELLRMIGQVADGMAYLFSQRIIHGDIATRNCLVSSALQVKIGDLGIGHELYPGDYYDNGAQLLPIRWMPPELLVESEEGPNFSLHSDTWSFGVFCWEVMAFGRLPYDNYEDEEVLAMIPAGSRLRSPNSSCPPAFYLVMMECWEEVPDNRPQFSRILSALATLDLEDM